MTSKQGEGGAADEGETDSSVEDTFEIDKARQAITGRSVTLSTLLKDKIIEPGEGVLSIDYLGQKFVADLLPSGKIKGMQSTELFLTPSAWAIHCKKLVNPDKKSGCGWASVKYRGNKLDVWKSRWCRKQRPGSPYTSSAQKSPASHRSNSPYMSANQKSPASYGSNSPYASTNQKSPASYRSNSPLVTANQKSPASHRSNSPYTSIIPRTNSPNVPSSPLSSVGENGLNGVNGDHGSRGTTPNCHDDGKAENGKCDSLPFPAHTTLKNGSSKSFYGLYQENVQEEALNLSMSGPHAGKESSAMEVDKAEENKSVHPDKILMPGKRSFTCRTSLKYSSLGKRSNDIDPNKLIECERFSNYNKIQPFTVTITTNAMIVMDFHCHLTTSEVVGYLGGRWDPQTQHITILEAFPCRCRLGDKDRAPSTEDEIRQNMSRSCLQLVGWYHSHPHCQPDPSLKDIDCQMSYQLKMKGTGTSYHPCLGFIVSAYDVRPSKNDAIFQAFWAMPPAEQYPDGYGIPMKMKYSVYQNTSLSEELLAEMKKITEFYREAPDRVIFLEKWINKKPFIEKLKSSLATKLPSDQIERGTFLDYVEELLLPNK